MGWSVQTCSYFSECLKIMARSSGKMFSLERTPKCKPSGACTLFYPLLYPFRGGAEEVLNKYLLNKWTSTEAWSYVRTRCVQKELIHNNSQLLASPKCPSHRFNYLAWIILPHPYYGPLLSSLQWWGKGWLELGSLPESTVVRTGVHIPSKKKSGFYAVGSCQIWSSGNK